jgi:rare lipoprotein A
MDRRILHFLLLAGFLLVSCGTSRRISSSTPTGFHQLTGIASYYSEEFNGRATASGEIFDMYELTAAHRTLPFGTILNVVNLDNGKEVQVRVNDRGPFVDDRVIDLSLGAAKEIDMIATGTARVAIEVVGSVSK